MREEMRKLLFGGVKGAGAKISCTSGWGETAAELMELTYDQISWPRV